MRLFIAINFDEIVRDKILSIENKVRENAVRGSFSREPNLHLTLVFLGEIEEDRVKEIEAVMNGISCDAFELTFDQLGRFRRESGDLWWLGIRKNRGLLAMREALHQALAAKGFVLEQKKFSPHLTLGRQVILEEELDRHIEPFSTTIAQISLMGSERLGSQLAYTELHRKRFRTCEKPLK